MDTLILFVVKLIDQLLRTRYLLAVAKMFRIEATILVGLQQLIHILITVYIVTNYSLPNILALISSTMLGTWLTINKKEI